ncbi:MAG: class A beta-lactamase [Rhodomicrobium sp.]|nr:class A beta-lactamase [Rhodomicrobium sp.]
MKLLTTRRQALLGAAIAVPALLSDRTQAETSPQESLNARLAGLEQEHGGRLGVAILNIATGAKSGHRVSERFLMCSTFKTLLAAFILARIDRGEEKLDRRITFAKDDLVEWSPVTETRFGDPGITVSELCEATITLSDNTAANLLLASFGGPKSLTDFIRGLDDHYTRLDRFEPDLNEHDSPGDIRDTTTPAAMIETLRKLIFTDVLSQRSRSLLTAWHIANKTGDERLRAGFPRIWLVGDKTGTNRSGNANDIGFAWPLNRGPILVTAFYEISSVSGSARNKVLAEVGRISAEF